MELHNVLKETEWTLILNNIFTEKKMILNTQTQKNRPVEFGLKKIKCKGRKGLIFI